MLKNFKLVNFKNLLMKVKSFFSKLLLKAFINDKEANLEARFYRGYK